MVNRTVWEKFEKQAAERKYLRGVKVEKVVGGYRVRKGDGYGEVGFGLTNRMAASLVRKLVGLGVRVKKP